MTHAAELAEQEMEGFNTCWIDPKWGFATDDAIDEIFRNLPRLVRDKRDGSIELIDYDNAAEWRGDLERKPSLYQWLPINGNTL